MKFKQDFFKDSDPRVNLVQPDRTLTSWPYCNCKKTFLTKHGGCRCSWLPSPRRLFTNFYKPKPNHNANEIAIKMRNFFNMNFGVAINQNRANYQVKKLYQTISNPNIFFFTEWIFAPEQTNRAPPSTPFFPAPIPGPAWKPKYVQPCPIQPHHGCCGRWATEPILQPNIPYYGHCGRTPTAATTARATPPRGWPRGPQAAPSPAPTLRASTAIPGF